MIFPKFRSINKQNNTDITFNIFSLINLSNETLILWRRPRQWKTKINIPCITKSGREKKIEFLEYFKLSRCNFMNVYVFRILIYYFLLTTGCNINKWWVNWFVSIFVFWKWFESLLYKDTCTVYFTYVKRCSQWMFFWWLPTFCKF